MHIPSAADRPVPAAPPRRPPAHRGFLLLRIASVLLPLLAVLGAGLLSWRDVEREAAARIDRTAEMLRQHALRAFATQDAILAAAARVTAGIPPQDLPADRAAHELLADLAAAGAPVVGGILVTDAEDRIALASYEFPARPADLSDRDYIRALHAGGVDRTVGEVGPSRPMGWTVFAVARRYDSGRIVVSSFSPVPFAEFYRAVKETPEDVVVLARRDGAVLVRTPEIAPATAQDRRADVAARLAQLLEGQPLRAESPVDGVTRLLVAREVGDWPVAVVYGLSAAALRQAWRARMVAPAAGGVAAAALLLLLTATAAQGARRRHAEAEARAEAEAQLARAGRAAAIGLLAGGVAHDVKNLVQTVRSGARVLERRAEDAAEVRRITTMLAEAAQRGGRLVDAMIAFARGGAEASAAARLDVSRVLPEVTDLLARALGSGWKLRVVVPADLPAARGDRAGFEAAVVNLAANARDAMPGGGTVTLAAWTEQLDTPLEEAGLRPGRYVVTAVRDEGIGMDREILARLGEPFFTTKQGMGGTGLGLSTVRGFCAGFGGALRVDSAPGAGTTAAIWLPAA